ncbi:hypothetical protein P4T89_12805 [Bacillus nakamurai]|uniref:Uncharacterized protein n=1 Tax=Bacillus nakamurai TaxID=1793963 RepID=A0A150FAV7_9BACI|nr:hypothetical protein [Bacillus nakamurai]KXZ22382.1 hypothetical protein AXI58_10350 [Bacillus nakamurai]MED1228395.1 hypothetical protein [Bacillus nakamurai]
MNWLDNYIQNNETGYLVGSDEELWVDMKNGYVRSATGTKEPVGLIEITKNEFIKKLVERVS